MNKLILLCIWLVTSSIVKSEMARPVFGVNVSIGANSQITSFVCFLYNGRVLTQKKIMDKETFVKIVSGIWPSIYNPKRIDFFKEHDIDCAMVTDSITEKKVVGCLPMDSLWKIRFATYPFQNGSEMGWSNKYYKPSPNQEKYLCERYAISHIDGDYFLDTNFWKLMKDVIDVSWIENYKSIH